MIGSTARGDRAALQRRVANLGWLLCILLLVALFATGGWFRQTGSFLLPFALLLVVGLVLLWRGVFGRRIKGQARCPGCRCDMHAALPSLECPECGHDAGRKRRLFRTRRSTWRVAAGAVLLLLCIYPLTIIGGWCIWSYGFSAGHTLPDTATLSFERSRIGPAWLVPRLPQGFGRFFDRHRLLGATVNTDAGLAACVNLRDLPKIMAVGPGVTDVGLAHLQRMSQLQRFGLHAAPVTAAGLTHLQSLAQLQHLNMSGTKVTDADLVHIERLSQLENLNLSGTLVTNAGLVHLRGLTQIQEFHLSGTQVTGAGFVHLKGLTRLRRLHLRGAQVTNSGLAHLHELPQLQYLDLTHTSVTDAELVHLEGLSQLLVVDLMFTKVTGAGTAKLKRALPNLRVIQ